MNPTRAMELRLLMEHEARMSLPPRELFGAEAFATVEKVCAHCHKTFDADKRYAGKKRYCSSECQMLANRPKSTWAGGVGKCAQCGSKMQMNRTGTAKKYCSRKCKTEAQRVRYWEAA